jgi:putative sterol carrier protein
MLALKNTFDGAAARGVSVRAEIRFATDTFRLTVDGDTIDIARGPADHPDVVIETDPDTLERVAFGGRDLGAAERAGEFRLGGDRAAAERLLGVFSGT